MRAEIRLCREDDLDALEWLGLHSGDRRILDHVWTQQERGEGAMLVADADGFPIAQLCIDLTRPPASGAALLWAIRTFPPLRNMGVGQTMMAMAEKFLGALGIARAVVQVDEGNRAALRFYRRLGWMLVTHASGPMRDREGRLIMAKRVPPAGFNASN